MAKTAAKTAHLIGICGAGMSAVAHLLQQTGYEVTGSDEGFYPPVSDYLEKTGLSCTAGYNASNIPLAPDVIVIGKNAKLTREDNEEVAAAFDLYPHAVRSFPEVLAHLTDGRERLVVAGSYGKSTLSGLISWCLADNQRRPGYFIGAIPKNFDTSSDIGTGAQFIFEGDEYPSANWDRRAKFLHYAPHSLVLTSACHDHVNIYPTLAAYHAPFEMLLDQLEDREGVLIACVAEENAAKLHDRFSGRKITYGLDQGAFQATDISLGHISAFRLVHHEKTLGTVTTRLLGRHNIENIVGAAAFLIGENILSFAEFAAAIATFDGLERRLDLKSESSRLPIYEGFGSSYEKARAAITALGEHYPTRRITAVFEPHTFTWRNRAAIHHYETAFNDTHHVMIYTPPTQGAHTHDQLTLDEIIARTTAHHPNVMTFDHRQFEGLVATLEPEEDIVLILSSGSFDGHLPEFITTLEALFS